MIFLKGYSYGCHREVNEARGDLGYKGETLQTFVKEQQVELRDEQKAKREAEPERREAENAKRKDEANIECEWREAEAKLEHEKLKLMEKIEAQKRYAAKESYEAETAKREAEELSKCKELEIMERI